METWASPYLAAHAAYLRHLGTAPSATVVERDGIYAVRTGVFSNTENGVVSTGSSPVSMAVADELIRWFDEQGVPASWLCAEGEGRSVTAAGLRAAGCRPERGGREMRASLSRLRLDVRDDVQVEPVASERELGAWLDVVEACGWFEADVERRRLAELLGGLGFDESAPFALYVARRGDEIVGSASAFYARADVLLTAVAVLDEVRRQGIGRSLALARLREARERGCTGAVLAPTPDGGRLYGALGFETYDEPPDRWFYLPASL